jgi:hypothetical protein
MKVAVKFDPSFDRIPHPDASLEESIDEVDMSTHVYIRFV